MRFSYTVPGRPVGYKRTNSYRGKRLTPKKYRKYRKAVALVARSSGVKTMHEPIGMEVRVYLPDRRRGDVDNYAKAHMDALEGVAYENDKAVVSLQVSRQVDPDNPRCEVDVWQMEE
jgi:Holliday junction resolvase RusA-like endonuclease